MLALTLALTMLAQSPQEMKSWVDQDGDADRPNAHVVSGMPELTPKEAWDSANARVREQRQERLVEAGRRYLEREAPAWLPDFVGNRVLREWCTEQGSRPSDEILDRDLLVRDHDFTRSYQGFLLVEERRGLVNASPRSLERKLRSAQGAFIRRCGATCMFWGLLALGAWWLDRLTRGYMTVRLRLLALAGGVVGPVLIMLL